MKYSPLLLTGLLLSSQAHALGLGEARTDSYLGQPLRATIPLLLEPDEQRRIAELRAQVAAAQMFERLQLEYHPQLSALEVSIQQDGSNYWLALSSSQPIREPMLEIPIEVRLGNVRLLRSVSLLLDPPVHPRVSPPSAITPAAPAPAPVTAPPSRVVEEPPRPRRPAAAVMVPRLEDGHYGPIPVDQSLGEIAQTLRPEGTTFHQTVIALWQHNPEAFRYGNINHLMAGSTLKVPSAEQVAAIDPQAARQEVVHQYQNPRSPGRAVATRALAPPPAPEEPEAPPLVSAPLPAEEARPTPESRLTLITPSELDEIPPAFRDEVQQLNRQLHDLNVDNRELRDQIATLERHIAKLTEQVFVMAQTTLVLTEEGRVREIPAQPVVPLSDPSESIQQAPTLPEQAPLAIEAPVPAQQESAPAERQSVGVWIRNGLIGAGLLLGLVVAVAWYRRLRQRERYLDVMYRL